MQWNGLFLLSLIKFSVVLKFGYIIKGFHIQIEIDTQKQENLQIYFNLALEPDDKKTKQFKNEWLK